ncbi:Predicted chitinase [Chryseobacterium culicis]|uniref:Predicted chitinase n=2 Tax=Chryseobacterium culicis TaxID=680127 RepID=A0A1H6HN79_CHRCI|nr:Predicted chitinase [Chryseobacterium culicis]
MDRLKNDGEGNTPETQTQNTAQDDDKMKADNKKKMDDKRAENEEKDKTEEGLLLAIDGAKIKFNAHLGTFKVLNNVPTTQDKLTGTIVEKQIPNFIFDDGFQMISLTDWQDFGTAKVQENFVLLKKSTLPGTGKMPGNIPPESGKIEFVTSGQVNVPEKIDPKGAPVPEEKNDKKCFCNRDFTPDEIKEIVIALRKGEITGYTTQKTIEVVNGVKKKVSKKVALTVYDMPHTKDLLFANQSDIKRTEHLSVEDSSYDKVTDAINKALKNYDINTCIRKIHFIAQAHHESHRFRATFEGRTEKNTPSNYSGGYNFQGRGFMQITHDYNYIKYYNKVFKTKEDLKDKKFYKDKLIPFAQLLATNVEYAFDSAGWYWKNDDKVNAIGVNMNVAADQDNTLYVSQGINGKVKHPNGLEERIKYVADLKKIMKYENCINKKK